MSTKSFGPCSWLLAPIINDKITIKRQLLISFGVSSIICGGITLAVCYSLLYLLRTTASNNSKSIITEQTNSNILAISQEIAYSIAQPLQLLSQTVCLQGALYSYNLLQNTRRNSPINDVSIFSPRRYYREYKFVGECKYPNCPLDYGNLQGRSRFPNLPRFQNGSLTDTSVYLYSSGLGRAIQDDATWDANIASSDALNRVVNGLTYEDEDLALMYSKGPQTTVLFYVATSIDDKRNGGTYSVNRRFPGTIQNSTTYVPNRRPWFINAPINNVYLYGPYIETFTRQLVLTVSSRQQFSFPDLTNTGVAVNAAVLLLSDIVNIVTGVTYPYNGFGALITYSTSGSPTVVVWADNTISPFDETTQQFRTVSYFDANLAGQNLNTKGTFTYTNPNGVSYIVAVVPFFEVATYPQTSSQPGLVMLVFAEESLANQPYISVQNNIDDTTYSVTIQTIIIACVIIGVDLIMIFFFVSYLVYPLEKMTHVSAEVVKMSAEDEDNKNYGPLIDRIAINKSRTDEVGILALEYYNVICSLHNKNLAKKLIPKYVPNPFYSESPVSSWHEFYNLFLVQQNIPEPVSTRVETDAVTHSQDLDVLGEFTASKDKKQKYQQIDTQDQININIDNLGIQPRGLDSGNRPQSYRSIVSNTRVIDAREVEMVKKSNSPREVFIISGKKVGFITSAKTILYFFGVIVLAGYLAMMIVTVVSLDDEGKTWSTTATVDLTRQEVDTLGAIVMPKALAVESYLQQLGLETLIGSQFLMNLLTNQLSNQTRVNSGRYLQSFSQDCGPFTSGNQYCKYSDNGVYTHSGYYAPGEANTTAAQDTAIQNSYQIRLTSLWDIKSESFYYAQNQLSFLQFGLQSNGLTRYLPYMPSSGFTSPSSCRIDPPNIFKFCGTKYTESRCSGIPAYASVNYPAYDPRCRSWYSLGYNGSDNHAYFQYPRQSSTGEFVTTIASPIYNTTSFLGVYITNYFSTQLSNAVNELRILDNGYSYLIDALNPGFIVLHPFASSTCDLVSCAETFTNDEYEEFYRNVLFPINQLALNKTASVSLTYNKQGKLWRLNYYTVVYDTATYALIVTVPQSDIEESSISIQHSIDNTVTGMIILFTFVMVFLILVFVLLIRSLIRAIVNPINELRDLCVQVIQDDLSGVVPTNATSYDMKVLLEAFTSLMVALRFGSDSYAKGNRDRARQVFTESLNLFTKSKNLRGIGASENNLAAVEMSLGEFRSSEEHYKAAIHDVEQIIAKVKADSSATPTELTKLNRTRSDRIGNLVLLYLEENRFSEAFAVLEKAIVDDKKMGYIRGCVVKQGTLGHYYLKQGELPNAERTFASALTFVKRRDEELYDVDWNDDEAGLALQIALYNQAYLNEQKLVNPNRKGANNDDYIANAEDIEMAYLNALVAPSHMHSQTVTKIFLQLFNLFKIQQRAGDIGVLENICKANGISLQGDEHGNIGFQSNSKRVVFCLDYSGSMSGSKIRTAVSNIKTIFEEQIQSTDSFMLLHFDSKFYVDVDLGAKAGREEHVSQILTDLVSPSGATAMRDAIVAAVVALRKDKTENDWIITLTDGEDTSSTTKTNDLIDMISNEKHVNVIMMGIGSDVKAAELDSIAKASKKGIFLKANSDPKSINEAFGKVIAVIQGQVIFEDI